MQIIEAFDTNVLSLTQEEVVMILDDIIEEIAPEGKTCSDFTGGYIQQLKNSSQFVAYYGTKKGTNNKATAKVTIDDKELDLYYVMLKSKITAMKNDKSSTKKLTMTASERLMAKAENKAKSSPFGKK